MFLEKEASKALQGTLSIDKLKHRELISIVQVQESLHYSFRHRYEHDTALPRFSECVTYPNQGFDV